MIHMGWKNPSMSVTAQVYIVVLIGSKPQVFNFHSEQIKYGNQKASSGQPVALPVQ